MWVTVGSCAFLVAATVAACGDNLGWWRRLALAWRRRGLEPGDPDTPEWHAYRRACREIARRNAGPGGYQGGPLPPDFKPPPIPPAWRASGQQAARDFTRYVDHPRPGGSQ